MVDCVDLRDGQTPLHKACSSGTPNIVKFLLQHRPEVDIRDFLGNTALHVACSARNEYAVCLLVQAGADVDRMYNDGATALHVASNLNETGIVRLLLQHDADVDFKDNAGRTPLHGAAIAGAEEAAELLLQFRATVNLVDHWENTALHLCLVGRSVGVMEVLIRYGADVNMKDGDGDTVLHKVCRCGWNDVLELLLDNGADTEITDYDGMTALQSARQGGQVKVVDRLLQYAARPEPVSDEEHPAYAHSEQTPDAVEMPSHGPAGTIIEENVGAGASNIGSIADSNNNLWAGVRRDHGDGFILANYDNHEISFDAKLESIRSCVHEGRDMHEIQLKLNFMRPCSMSHRIRYAKVDVMLSPSNSGDIPNIRGIMPQADRMEVSEQEITSGQRFTVGASGNGGPSSVNISMEGSKSRRSTFKGVRIIHGAVKDRMHASWRLYEEPGSKSGLPEIVRLLMLVHCDAEFEIRLYLSAKACHFFTFGIPRTLTAQGGSSYLVPKLTIISTLEQESRLKQVLDVADRAATVVGEANKLEERLSRAILDHKKRDLIMEAGVKESHLQEWTDIVNASKFSDFRILREKLLRIGDTGNHRRTHQENRFNTAPPNWFPPAEQPWAPPPPRAEPRMYSGYPGRNDYNSAPRNALESFSAVGPGYTVSRLA
jgi:ankyrin repeat protein